MIRRTRALGTLWAFAPIVVAAALSLYRPAFLDWAERSTYDTLLQAAGTVAPDGRVVIVDIDERSLSTIGQWPWRRDVVGQLVSHIRSLGAAAIALDVLFAEPERTGGEPSTDARFAETLRGGRVVLGYGLTFERPAPESPSCVEHPLGLAMIQREADTDSRPFFDATGVVCSLPALATAAGASGFLNAAPDSDGILRRVPLLVEYKGEVYPSLALATVTSVVGARQASLQVTNRKAVTLSLDGRTVPLDGKSHLLVRYRGVKRTFPYVSAADVMSGQTSADTFADKLVFVGTTALGTREVVATPVDTQFAGVEVQATVADNLLRQDFFHRPHDDVFLETMVVLAFGIVVMLLVLRFGLGSGAMAAALCVAAGWFGAVRWFSAHGAFVSPLFPTLGAAGTLAVLSCVRLSVERHRADRAVADKAMSQRMMIQALLSLTETRDPETGRHSRRTTRNMRILAQQLATHPEYREFLTADRIDLAAMLAPLHDIGKVGVADRVLNKPGALTADELVEMRKHPEFGREVIERAARDIGAVEDDVLAMAKDIVYTHHEKWDGTGYPRGLRGTEIPIVGRLMAVVDVYDAVSTRSLYQTPTSHEDTVALIARGRGTHFDPAVVDSFLKVAKLIEFSPSAN